MGEYGFLFVHYGFLLAVWVPLLAVSVRRLHDTDCSGWWHLILLIPVIGYVGDLAAMAKDSQPGENRFGPSPKEVSPLLLPDR